MWLNPMWVPILAIVGGFSFIIVQSVMRGRVRELEIRQRIAMIEKGLVPPPEVDPQGFERVMTRFDNLKGLEELAVGARRRSPGRHRRAGILLIGVGLGLMLLIGLSGNSPREAVGVGGFIATLGAAFLVMGLLEDGSGPALPSRNSQTGSGPASPPTVG